MNEGLRGVGKLVASCDIFSDDIVQGNTAGLQLFLKVVKELELPLDPITILEFGSILVLSSALASSMSM